MEKSKYDVNNAISGVLVVDKPVGLTSHDVVEIIRKGTNIRRAGHTGTLDPRASGVLVVLIGPAVRLSEYVSASDKRYQAIIRLGTVTDTYDGDGQVLRSSEVNVTEDQFQSELEKFVGEIEQVPPAILGCEGSRSQSVRNGAQGRRGGPCPAQDQGLQP